MDKESELRQGTILFADISGFTAMSEKMNPEDVTSVMNNCFGMMEDIIKRYNGTIDKFIGDCVMVLFGIPTAIENAPQQAVNTAIEMRRQLYQFNIDRKLKYPLDIHIGINSGIVLAGNVGGREKKNYTVMGDTVNLASRLEDVSERGQILVGSETYKQVRMEYKFSKLKPVKLKGKERPVPVYELLSKKVHDHVRLTANRMIQSKMVGRKEELKTLIDAVVKAKNSEGSVINIIGEAGLGKSRLIAEFKNSDLVKELTILEGRALSIGRNLSYFPLIEMLKELCNIEEDDTSITQFQKLKETVFGYMNGKADEITPFLASLMGLELTGEYEKRVRSIESGVLEKIIFKSIKGFIQEIAENTTLILIIDDLHWADTTTIELIIPLCRVVRDRKIIIINTFRPNSKETGNRVRKALSEDYPDIYSEIKLYQLDKNSSNQLIDNLLNIEGLPNYFKEKVRDRSEGNPFFIEEVIRSMIDQGIITVDDDRFSLSGDLNSVVIPGTIQELIMTRIDRLDYRTKSTLKIASVIGRHFFHRILCEIVGSSSEIDDHIHYLKEIQLIREGANNEETQYLFKHALAQETVYNSILLAKRKEMHLQVAYALEKIFKDRIHEFYGMLAYHFTLGEEMVKVEEYMFKAGEEAVKAAASSEAIVYFEKAIELYTSAAGDNIDRKKLTEIEQNLGLAFLTRGNWSDAEQHLRNVLTYYSGKNFKASIFNLIKAFYSIIITFYWPFQRSLTEPTERDNRFFDLLEKYAIAGYMTDIKRFFLEMSGAYCQLLKLNPEKSQSIFNSYAGISSYFYAEGLFKMAIKVLDYTNGLIKDKNSLSLYYLNLNIGCCNFFMGEWSYGFDYSVVNEALKSNEIVSANAYLLFGTWVVIEKGDFTMTQKNIQILKEIGEDYNDSHATLDTHELELISNIKRRNLSNLQRDFEAALKLCRGSENDQRRIAFVSLRLQYEVLSGDMVTAEKSFHEAEKLFEKFDKMSLLIFWYSRYNIGSSLYFLKSLEKAYLDGDKISISNYKKKALTFIKESVVCGKKFASVRTEVNRLMADYYRITGRNRKALCWYKKNIVEAERIGAVLELSRSYFELGKFLKSSFPRKGEVNGHTAEGYLDKARELFRELNLVTDIENLENYQRGK